MAAKDTNDRACERCVEWIFGRLLLWVCNFNSLMMKWNKISEVLRLMLLVIVAMGSQSVLNAGAWTWTQMPQLARNVKLKVQSFVSLMFPVFASL